MLLSLCFLLVGYVTPLSFGIIIFLKQLLGIKLTAYSTKVLHINFLYFCFFNFYCCRVIDFVNEMVRTLAGNGAKGSDYKGGGKDTAQARMKT